MKVLRGFEDLSTGTFYDAGTEYESNDNDRMQQLATAGLILTEGEPKDITDMTVKELKDFLQEKGIEYDDKAKKADLLELLKQAE